MPAGNGLIAMVVRMAFVAVSTTLTLPRSPGSSTSLAVDTYTRVPSGVIAAPVGPPPRPLRTTEPVTVFVVVSMMLRTPRRFGPSQFGT
jgi:hypothetical protein